MLTSIQKLKILQSFLCLISVNAVYKSGMQLNKDGKERQAFNVFEAELSLMNERRGRWASIPEFASDQFTMIQVQAATKSSNLTSEKIWEKGMAARRDLVSWIAEYGKILNFTVIKPLVRADEFIDSIVNKIFDYDHYASYQVTEGQLIDKELFDLELNEDSGGNADMELLKILRQVL